MLLDKKRKISATAILSCNLMSINGTMLQWVDAKDFNLADLVKTIGIDHDHKAKATITIEIIEQPSEICGKPTHGDKLCNKCDKLICDTCATTDAIDRYCPICSDLNKQSPET